MKIGLLVLVCLLFFYLFSLNNSPKEGLIYNPMLRKGDHNIQVNQNNIQGFMKPSELYLSKEENKGRVLAVGVKRSPISKRLFISTEVEKFLRKAEHSIKDKPLLAIFKNTFPNCLDTTVYYKFDEISNMDDTWIITGDIDRMWQRDAGFQVMPYLGFAKNDAKLRAMIRGVINRQMKNVIIDPYSCAFNYERNGGSESNDKSGGIRDGKLVLELNPSVNSRKYEVDSLAAPLFLSMRYYERVKDLSFLNTLWFRGLDVILKTCRAQQRSSKEEDLYDEIDYYFKIIGVSNYRDNLYRGRGRPSRRTGMVKSAYRPSDDQGMLPFHVAGNAMLAVALDKVAELLRRIGPIKYGHYIKECSEIAKEIKEGIMKYGVIKRANGKKVFAAEVDGFGGHYFADDPNVPSILSLPYLGFIDLDDPIYLQTREELFDTELNTYFFKDSKTPFEGGWSPHSFEGNIWPMSIIMRALTSRNDEEISKCLEWLRMSHGGSFKIHESFNPNDPSDYTREWFSWANSLFSELILNLIEKKPHILQQKFL